MKKLSLILAFIVAMIFVKAQNFHTDYLDGQLYFKLYNEIEPFVLQEDDVVKIEDISYLNSISEKYGIEKVTRPYNINNDEKLLRTYKIEFSQINSTNEFIEELSQIEDVEYAEMVPLYKIDLIPNDPLYNSVVYNYNWNWHLDKIRASLAWSLTTGSPSVKVAVVDNAIYVDHPDLSGKIYKQYDVADYDNNANPPSVGFTHEEQYAWSHGTHTAGLVAAKSNNNVGIASIGYDVEIIAVKASKNQSYGEYTTHTMAGVQWAYNNGADIISLSVGGSGYSSSELNVYNAIRNDGVVVIASAGNDGDNGNPVKYPAAYSSVIAVGSTNFDDKRSSFSEYGMWLDVSAPGGYYPSENSSNKISVVSSIFCKSYILDGIPGFTNEKYDIMQGTSMSCPIVSGLAALILSVNPNMSVQGVKNCLQWGSINIDSKNPGFAGKLGAGRIDALNSVKCAMGTSIEELEKTPVVLYPNPAFEYLNISIPVNDLSNLEVAVYNQLGELVQSNFYSRLINTDLKLDVTKYKPGVYFINLKSDEFNSSNKFVVIN